MTYEKYLQHAEECEQLAKIAKLPSNQDALLTAAEMWRKMADDAKRTDGAARTFRLQFRPACRGGSGRCALGASMTFQLERCGEPMRSDARPWHGGRLLVCEDDLLMADVVCQFLRECHLTPTGPVGRLESAVQMARERALDGAILDINLNGRPCFPICPILSTRHIPFIFLTGYTQAAIPIEYRRAPLITKPFQPNEMKEVLADMLGPPEDWPPPEDLRSDVRH